MDWTLFTDNLDEVVNPILKSLGKNLYDSISSALKGKLAQREIEQKVQALLLVQSAVNREELIEYIKYKYPNEPLLERCGYTYPVAVYPSSKAQRSDIESVLRKPLLQEELEKEDFIINDQGAYRAIVADLLHKSSDIDDMVYSMQNFVVENGEQKLSCQIGSYFNSYDTSEALEWEIRSKIDKLTGYSTEAFDEFTKYLPLRNKLHQAVSNPVHNGAGRCPAVGIATLVAYKEDDTNKYQLLVRRRAQKGVPIRAGLLHVIPSFMFQPTTTIGIESEYNVEHNILREFLEELYGRPEQRIDGDPKTLYRNKPVKEMRLLLTAGKAQLYFTGIGINLLNLRPEICTLLVVSDPEWYRKSLEDEELEWRFNEEFATINDRSWLPAKQLVGKIEFAESEKDDPKMLKAGLLHPALTVPAGAAAFWLGVDTLRAIQRENT